jgi:hypothetical protein
MDYRNDADMDDVMTIEQTDESQFSKSHDSLAIRTSLIMGASSLFVGLVCVLVVAPLMFYTLTSSFQSEFLLLTLDVFIITSGLGVVMGGIGIALTRITGRVSASIWVIRLPFSGVALCGTVVALSSLVFAVKYLMVMQNKTNDAIDFVLAAGGLGLLLGHLGQYVGPLNWRSATRARRTCVVLGSLAYGLAIILIFIQLALGRGDLPMSASRLGMVLGGFGLVLPPLDQRLAIRITTDPSRYSLMGSATCGVFLALSILLFGVHSLYHWVF